MLAWFHDNKGWGWFIAIAYLIVVTLTHDLVQRPALIWQRSWGIELVHYINIVLGGIALIWLGMRLKARVLAHPDSRRMIITAVLWLFVAVVTLKLIMVRSIESIHIIQYGILAVMLCALTRSPIPAALLATFGGAFDEAWQFFVLRPRQPYFDFNDTVINAVGAVGGCWMYLLYTQRERVRWSSMTAVAATWGATIALVFVMFGSGWITVYQGETGIAMHRRPPPTPERPVKYIRSNKWENMSIRLHPYIGVGLTLLIPLGVGAMKPSQIDPDA